MGELENKEILDMKFIDKETGEVVMTYPGAEIEWLKEFVDFEPIVDKDDYWGRWNQDTMEWLLESLSSGKIK